MTTLAADKARTWEIGERNEFPVIASDIIYEGAAVGVVNASGHARPLTSDDLFVGFAEKQADNSSGNAADINVRVVKKGAVVLPVTGAVITDVNNPVYASDDDTFTFSPASGVFIGLASRFVSSGYMVVEFDAGRMIDPWAGYTCEALSASTKTANVEDAGKLFCVSADSVITLPATAVAVSIGFLCVGAYGDVQISLDPVSDDKIMGPDIAGENDHDLVNTKATACRGDFCLLRFGHTDGPVVEGIKGTWATES
jgi:hypothetical protein